MIVRVLRAVASATLVSLVLASVVLAADPTATAQPTVGGRLALGVHNDITVTSGGNVPALVTMSAESPDVKLSETTFALKPGESHTLTFTGPATGKLLAYMEVAKQSAATQSQEYGTATLSLNLKPYSPPFPWAPLGITTLFIIGGLFLAYRGLKWTRANVRIVRAPAPAPVYKAPARHGVPVGVHASLKPLDENGNPIPDDESE